MPACTIGISCIARRECILFEAEREAADCGRRFLAETSTSVEEEDIVCLLQVLDQVRFALWTHFYGVVDRLLYIGAMVAIFAAFFRKDKK